MKRWMTMLLLLLLLPAGALGVTEGVVESAEQVVIELPKKTTALFGAWEQGLSDIRLAAHNAAMSWADFPEDMKLEFLQMSDFSADGDVRNDTILVRFVYRDEMNRERRVLLRYLRGTGKLIQLSDTVVWDGRRGGEQLEENVLHEIAMNMLENRYGETDPELKEIVGAVSEDNWIGRFEVERGMYEVVLRRTGEMTRVSLDITP